MEVIPRGGQSDHKATWGWGGYVGRWVLAVRLEKRHPFSRLPQRRDGLFPCIEHQRTTLGRQFGISIAPREGGSILKWALLHHQTRWGGRNRRISGKMALSLVKWFFAHLLDHSEILIKQTFLNENRDLNRTWVSVIREAPFPTFLSCPFF